MSRLVECPGLRVENPLAMLVALGSLELLGQQDPESALAWTRAGAGWHATLHVDGALASTAELASHLSEMTRKVSFPALPEDVKKVQASTMRQAIDDAEDATLALLSAIVSERPSSSKVTVHVAADVGLVSG